MPAVVGAIGVAGGVVLGRTALQRQKKVLGVPMPMGKVRAPKIKIDLADVGDQSGKLGTKIGDAGSNLAKLAREIQTTREKAEKLGRRSPNWQGVRRAAARRRARSDPRRGRRGGDRRSDRRTDLPLPPPHGRGVGSFSPAPQDVHKSERHG